MVTSDIVRQKVFDPIQRILHWWIGASVMGLVALGWVEKFSEVGNFRTSTTEVHIFLGFVLTIGFAARLIWGVVGPEHARFKSFWHATIWKQMIGRVGKVKRSGFGHDPSASVAYLVLYVIIAFGVLTGLLLAGMRYDQGPFANMLFDELSWHEFSLIIHNMMFYGATLFIIAHVMGMIRQERKSGLPVAQSMISGFQYRRVKKGDES